MIKSCLIIRCFILFMCANTTVFIVTVYNKMTWLIRFRRICLTVQWIQTPYECTQLMNRHTSECTKSVSTHTLAILTCHCITCIRMVRGWQQVSLWADYIFKAHSGVVIVLKCHLRCRLATSAYDGCWPI